MQAVLIRSTYINDVNGGDWKTNAAGYKYSHKYGFGLLDAWTATQTAKTWENLTPEVNEVKSWEGQIVIKGGETKESSIEMTSNGMILEHSRAILNNIRCQRRGDLSIWLISPSGMVSALAEPHGDTNSDYKDWDYGSLANYGETSKGKYTLKVTNHGGSDAIIHKWTLSLFGHQV